MVGQDYTLEGDGKRGSSNLMGCFYIHTQILYVSIYIHVISSKVDRHNPSIQIYTCGVLLSKRTFPAVKWLHFWLLEGKLLSYIILNTRLGLMFLRGSIRNYFSELIFSERTQNGISLADLLTSLVFHLLSRQCDPARKPKAILVYYCSQTGTLSQNPSESYTLFLI